MSSAVLESWGGRDFRSQRLHMASCGDSQSGSFTEQFGMSTLPHLLAAAEPPTAAFVASDYVALGVLSAAEQQVIRVPDDLSSSASTTSGSASTCGHGMIS